MDDCKQTLSLVGLDNGASVDLGAVDWIWCLE